MKVDRQTDSRAMMLSRRALLACLVAFAACVPQSSLAMDIELIDDTLYLSGASMSADDWVVYRERTQGKKFSRVVLVNQPGGRVDTALGIAEDLIERRVATVALGYCQSACTYIFLAGERRQFGGAWPVNRTRLGFHGAYSTTSGTLGSGITQAAAYYRSRLDKKGLEVIENALLQFPDKRGFLYIYHPSHRQEASACPGSVDDKCARIGGVDAASLGLITSPDLAEVRLPEKLVAREHIFGVELNAFQRVSDTADLVKECPQGTPGCARALQEFAKRPPDRAVALSPTGRLGLAWGGGSLQAMAQRALYECVRRANVPCRLAAVNDYLTRDLYSGWARDSGKAVAKLKTLISEKVTDERYEDQQTELPMARLRTDTFAGPTPETIPGVKEVGTKALLQLLSGGEPAALIDVWCADSTLPSAKCLLRAGLAFTDPTRDQAHEKLLMTLLDAMIPEKHTPVVFFSAHENSWLSANAAFRAARNGRTVLWYRGGLNAWKKASLPTVWTAPVGALTE